MKSPRFSSPTGFLSTKSAISLLINLLMASSPFVIPRTFNLVGLIPSLLFFLFGTFLGKINIF